jgi:hypothetical protein
MNASQYDIENYNVTYSSLINGFPGSANNTEPFSYSTVISFYNSTTPGVTYNIFVYSIANGAVSSAVSINCTSGTCKKALTAIIST